MVFAGKRCLKLHRIMFTIMGLWPYQNLFIWRIQTVFFFSSFCCTLFFQFTAFLTTTCNMECILKRFSYICICLVYVCNYYSFYFASETLKQVLQHIQLDWKMFEGSSAMKIFEEYLSESYIFTCSTIIFTCIIGVVFLTFECRAVLLDIIIPLNVSRPRNIEIEFESFVDKQRYFFLYLMQEILGTGIGFSSIITTASFWVMLVKHFSAAHKIASYIMQNTMTSETFALSDSEKVKFMHRNICLSVNLHRRTMKSVSSLLFAFDLWYFPLLLIGVVSLSCILFRLYNAIMQFNDFYDILISCVILYCYLIYMAVGNFLAQSYTDHSVKLLDTAYESLWYLTPLTIQQLFLIMQKSIKCHVLVLGGLFALSVEGLSTLLTSAVSYFTVMHAMR